MANPSSPPELTVNGEVHRTRAATLLELLRELGHDPERAGLAVAVNGEVVRRAEWAARALRAGDRVEIVGAVQGG